MKFCLVRKAFFLTALLLFVSICPYKAHAIVTFDLPAPGNSMPDGSRIPPIGYIDTSEYTTSYAAISGNVHATSTKAGATITYTLTNGNQGAIGINLGNGKYSYTCRYGTLEIVSLTGAYTFYPSPEGINSIEGAFTREGIWAENTDTTLLNNIVITASDGSSTATSIWRISPTGFDDSPRVVGIIPDQVVTVGKEYRFKIPNEAFDAVDWISIGGVYQSERLRYALVGEYPDWLQITNSIPGFLGTGGPNDAALSNTRTLTFQDTGSYTITLRATANDGGATVPNFVDTTFTLTVVKSEAKLVFGFEGDGQGTVTSSPAGISCSPPTCPTAIFEIGKSVILAPTPSIGSIFTLWSGDCQPINEDGCLITMDTDKIVTATFSSLRWIRINSAPDKFYGALKGAYEAAADLDDIQLSSSALLNEELIIDRVLNVKLSGGYDGDWFNSGVSTLHGSIRISTGRLTVSNLRIRP